MRELAELQAQTWPEADPARVTEIFEKLVAKYPKADWFTRELLEEHLSHYIGEDPRCGAAMFTWGYVHGAGFCARCSWPGRLYHYIYRPGISVDERYVDGANNLVRFESILWAHPKEVESGERVRDQH